MVKRGGTRRTAAQNKTEEETGITIMANKRGGLQIYILVDTTEELDIGIDRKKAHKVILQTIKVWYETT